jgi:uncharacterized membrane protein
MAWAIENAGAFAAQQGPMPLSNARQLELSRGLIQDVSWVQRAKAEVTEFLPAWMFLLYGALLLNSGLTNFDPPRPEFSTNVLFPLAVFVGFYVVRALRAPEVEHRWPMVLVALGLAVCLPLINIAYHRPSPVTGRGLLVAFELSNFVFAALMLWHARRARRGHAALFFGAGMLYGLLLENGGILLGFFHETNLTLTVVKPFVAPAATMIGWSIMLYMASFVVWQLRRWVPSLRRQHLLAALLVGVLATLLDLQIDPLATAARAWVWDSSLPPWFHGVPLVNFVAWICALTPFAWAMFRAQERLEITDAGPWTSEALKQMVMAVPGALIIAALMFMVSTALLEGINGPSWTLLNQFWSNGLAVVLR